MWWVCGLCTHVLWVWLLCLCSYDVTVSADGKFMCLSTWQHEARVYNLVSKAGAFSAATKVMNFTGHTKSVTGVAFSPESEVAYTCSLDG
jgi:hypothetical protein